jgi:hypothetical protein
MRMTLLQAVDFTKQVRNDLGSLPVNMVLSYKTPVGDPNRPIPTLLDTTVEMVKGDCVGSYTFYTATYEGLGGLGYATKIDVVSGSGASARRDDFKAASDLGGTCIAFGTPPASSCAEVSDPAPPESTSSPTGTVTAPPATVNATSSATVTSPAPIETAHHRQTLGDYQLVGCKTEGTGVRALGGASFAYDGMTLESCMKNCTGFYYWGTEYGRECKLLTT